MTARSVLAVADGAAPFPRLGDTATALAMVLGAGVRWVDLAGVAGPAGRADRVLAELARPDAVLGVVPGVASARRMGWRVLERAGKPVVVVPDTRAAGPSAGRMINRALVPLDGTPESAAAVAGTLALLSHAGVDLVVLHVFDAATVPRFWDHAGHAERAWQDEFTARYCADPGVRVRLRSGVPGEHVLDVAAAEGVDLIALGWSRASAAGHARTLRRTLREATVPVLVIPMTAGGSGTGGTTPVTFDPHPVPPPGVC